MGFWMMYAWPGHTPEVPVDKIYIQIQITLLICIEIIYIGFCLPINLNQTINE